MSPVTSGQLSSISSTHFAVCLDALNGTSERENDEEVFEDNPVRKRLLACIMILL